MEGDPSIPVLVDSWMKGLQDFDIDEAYKGMEEDKPCWIAPDLSEGQWWDMCLPDYWEKNGLKNFDGVVSVSYTHLKKKVIYSLVSLVTQFIFGKQVESPKKLIWIV